MAKKNTPNIDRESIRLFWRASWAGNRLLLLGTLAFPIGTIFLSTVAPLFIGKILATLGRPEMNPNQYLVWFGVSAVIGILGNRFGFQAFLRYQAQTMRHLQGRGLEMLLNRSVGFHNNNVGGKLVSDASDFPSGFGQFVNAVYVQLIPFAVTVISGTVLILF
jgi:ABC-type multidrug transport system fused ATPase/permease subunit